MTAGGLRALEFDRVVAAVRSFALTTTGAARLDALTPATELAAVREALAATSETVSYLASNPVFPLRAPEDLETLLGLLGVEGRALEPLRLLALSDYLESVETSAAAVRRAPGELPRLKRLVGDTASFKNEIGAVRHAIAPSGDVVDHASAGAGIDSRPSPASARETAADARRVSARQGHREVPAGPDRHRAQRALRPARESRAPRVAARAGARQFGQRPDALSGAARDRRDQQRGRRARGRGSRGGAAHPAFAHRRVPPAARRCGQDRAGSDRTRRPAGQGASRTGNRRRVPEAVAGRAARIAGRASSPADARRRLAILRRSGRIAGDADPGRHQTGAARTRRCSSPVPTPAARRWRSRRRACWR